MKVWLSALAITLAILFAWESACRRLGVQPSPVRDSPQLWTKARMRASKLGPEAVVLVGSSRIQLGMNLTELARYTKHHPVQLAIDGAAFMPILADLARDESVVGTVIVSLDVPWIGVYEDARVAEWLAHHAAERRSQRPLFYRTLEDSLTSTIDRWFPSRTVGVKPRHVVARALFGGGDFEHYFTTFPDRSRQADYTKVRMPDFYLKRVKRQRERFGSLEPVVLPDFDQWLVRLEALVARLQARGARVVLVRFPTDKAIWEMDERRFPRADYWDRLAAHTSAETIHFRDYPELCCYPLPDGSHLDYRDAIPFTNALARIIFGDPAA